MIGPVPDLRSGRLRLSTRVAFLGLLAASALAVPVAGAQPVDDEPLFPADRICRPGASSETRSLDPLRLIRWLIAISDIGDAALDADGDGSTLLAEKQLALVQPGYCTQDVGRACTAEEALTLARIQQRLADFVERAGGSDYVFERVRRPTLEERIESEVLNPFYEVTGRRFQVAEVLDVRQRFVQVYCTAPEAEAPQTVADIPAPEIVEEEEKPLWIFNPRDADGLRLTSTVDDLTKDRNALGAVRPAELSITADLDDDQTLYQVKAVVGYNVEVERTDLIYTSTIPFVLIERFFNGEENEIDTLGFGLQEAFSVFQPDRSGSEVAITPLYLTDSDFDTDIGVLKLRWTPALAPDSALPIGFSRAYGPLALQFDIDALADLGRVFDDAGDQDLADSSEFFRVGGRLGVQFRGSEDSGFDHIALDISNRYLKDIDGADGDLYRLDLSLSYLFSQSDNYRLSVSYVSGLADDTYEETEYWKTQFGVRF
ncbi:MAG: hypothetical protein HC871_13100 [Rhizobiales bacterium]|nr:hypothetical protein [Hyphomicrobiales bacterium]